MYEYKVVPAPVRAAKVKGLRSTAARFAHALAESINAEAAGGWQFQRTESLTCEERSRLGRSKMSVQTVMVFAREAGVVRPDAGAALAAAQGSQRDEVSRRPTLRPVQASPEPEMAEVDERPEPETLPEEPVLRAPRPHPSRQEPLFRSTAIKRPEQDARPEGRPEPILRPLQPRKTDPDQE